MGYLPNEPTTYPIDHFCLRAEIKAVKRLKVWWRAGQIYTYVHQGRVGVMVDLRCATDFVARTTQFQDLCKALALQVAAGLEDDLLAQPCIRNPQQSMRELLDQISRQVGEVITVKRTVRWSLEDS